MTIRPRLNSQYVANQLINNENKMQTFTFSEPGPMTDSSIPIDTSITGATRDLTNSTNANDLAGRLINFGQIVWNHDTADFIVDPTNPSEKKSYLYMPDAVFTKYNSTGLEERTSPVFTVLRKWKYLKSDLTIRFAFNFNQYTQGKLILYFLPFAQEHELQSMSLTRAQQLRHVILDANSSRNYTEFTIPFQEVYGAFDLVQGIGTMGAIGLKVLNPLKSASAETGQGECHVSFSNASLGVNNATGRITNPTGYSKKSTSYRSRTPTPFVPMAGDGSHEGELYQNFPQKNFTHINNQNPTNLLAIDQNQATTGTKEGFTNCTMKDLPQMAKTYNYLGTFNSSISDLNPDVPLLSIPINPCIVKPLSTVSEVYDDAELGPYVKMQAYDSCITELAYATSQANYFRGGLKYKFQITKTPTHVQRLRFTYIPFNSLGEYTPNLLLKQGIPKDNINTLSSNAGQGDNNVNPSVHDTYIPALQSNVINKVYDISELDFIEFEIPYNAIYDALHVLPINRSGTAIGPINGQDHTNLYNPSTDVYYRSDGYDNLLSLPSMLGQLNIYPYTALRSSELTSPDIQINVSVKASDDFKLYMWTNDRLNNISVPTLAANHPNPEFEAFGEHDDQTVDEPPPDNFAEVANEVIQDVALGATAMFLPEALPALSALISRPGLTKLPPADSSGRKNIILDPNDFQSDGNSKQPIDYYSYLYRFYSGMKKWLFHIPQQNTTNITNTYIQVNDDAYADLVQPIDTYDNIDPSTFCDKLKKDLKNSTVPVSGFYSYIKNEFPEYYNEFTTIFDTLGNGQVYDISPASCDCKPGSPFYHNSSLTLEDIHWPAYDSTSNLKTMLKKRNFLPLEFHSHSYYSLDGNYFDITSPQPPIYMPNLSSTFFMSDSQQLAPSPFVGCFFRDGNFSTGKYWTITNVDPYTCTTTVSANFSNETHSFPNATIIQNLATGVWEVFQNPNGTTPNFHNLPTVPVEKDLKYGKITAFDSENNTYSYSLYETYDEEDAHSIISSNNTILASEFENLVGTVVSDFSGTLSSDLLPTGGKLRYIADITYQDENGKDYQIPLAMIKFLTMKVEDEHQHSQYAPHSHGIDGTITLFGVEFHSDPEEYFTINELYAFLTGYYTWFLTGDNAKGASISQLGKMMMWVSHVNPSGENYDPDFRTKFRKWYFNGEALYDFSTMINPNYFRHMVSMDKKWYWRFLQLQLFSQLQDMFDSKLPNKFVTFEDPIEVPVIHNVYGHSIHHVHKFYSQHYFGYSGLESEKPPLGAFRQVARIASCSYTYGNMLGLVSEMQSSLSLDLQPLSIISNSVPDPSTGFINIMVGGISNALAVTTAIIRVIGSIRMAKDTNKIAKTNEDILDTSNEIQDFDYSKMANEIGKVLNLKLGPFFETLADNNSTNGFDYLLDGLGDIKFDYPIYPDDILTTCRVVNKELKPVTSRSQLEGASPSLQLSNNTIYEDFTAHLAPAIATGPTLSPFLTNTELETHGYSLNSLDAESHSFPTSILSPVYSNFFQAEVPFYSNTPSQLIGYSGSKNIKGCGRPIGYAKLQSGAVASAPTTALFQDGAITDPLDAHWRTSIPYYGYEHDGDQPYSMDLLYSQQTTSTAVKPITMGVSATPSFSYGEFIGIPLMRIQLLRCYSTATGTTGNGPVTGFIDQF